MNRLRNLARQLNSGHEEHEENDLTIENTLFAGLDIHNSSNLTTGITAAVAGTILAGLYHKDHLAISYLYANSALRTALR